MSAPAFSSGSSITWYVDRDPGNNESNVSIGNFWINTDTTATYICQDATAFEQVWTALN